VAVLVIISVCILVRRFICIVCWPVFILSALNDATSRCRTTRIMSCTAAMQHYIDRLQHIFTENDCEMANKFVLDVSYRAITSDRFVDHFLCRVTISEHSMQLVKCCVVIGWTIAFGFA